MSMYQALHGCCICSRTVNQYSIDPLEGEPWRLSYSQFFTSDPYLDRVTNMSLSGCNLETIRTFWYKLYRPVYSQLICTLAWTAALSNVWLTDERSRVVNIEAISFCVALPSAVWHGDNVLVSSNLRQPTSDRAIISAGTTSAGWESRQIIVVTFCFCQCFLW